MNTIVDSSHKCIEIYPSLFRQFGDASESTFYLVTNSHLKDVFVIEEDTSYKDFKILIYDPGDDFVELLKGKTTEPAHIVVITPDCLIESVPPEHLGLRRKLLIFPCNSAPSSVEVIEHFLRCGENISPIEQERASDQFFLKCEGTKRLQFIDDIQETKAEFHHVREFYGWHEQLGTIDWGGQQVFPSGEISCFLVPLKGINKLPDAKFDLTGEIALKGYPVVHSGPPSFLREDQMRIYERLSTFKDYALIATVEKGTITALRSTHPNAEPALQMLEDLFVVDSRFRKIFEIGFSLKNSISIWDGNVAMNESYGGEKGCIHFGLGMLPFTQYHIDIVCPNTKVRNIENKTIFG
jgi:hypothetical protein